MASSNFTKSYAKLNAYVYTILEANPGATVKIQYNLRGATKLFKLVFICFKAQQVGFLKEYRRFVGIDGTYLKYIYSAVLMNAVTVDANNGILPLAVAMCEKENKES